MARTPTLFDRRRAALEGLAESGEGFWSEIVAEGERVPCWTREFWTPRQRQASSLHEISYRACYKPQLPRLFIEALTQPGERVYDPFSGRGTTLLEAALLGRRVAANDINPLSALLAAPRLRPPSLEAVADRLDRLPRRGAELDSLDLSMFYHPDTEAEIRALRCFLDPSDEVDAWIRMVATNRLTGHSPGFFSVYTLPPNQALSPQKQIEINRKRQQVPPYRDTHALILKKSRQLLSDLSATEKEHLRQSARDAQFFTEDARRVPLEDSSITLTVTSPPFLDVVQYAADNWLRCWFCGLDAQAIGQGITMARTVGAWADTMQEVFHHLFRVTRPGGHVAFEVGEVRKGTLRLEEVALPLGLRAGFEPLGVLVNQQAFTKTANIWGVENNAKGTNSNRIVVFRKEG
ncbi:MAG: site-specific DNA-methyltransferase [Firmicutes bacterium]|nr:site-specific DNA-methyltransferase [Bacillota bacterium]